jgi:hypothetical protein
MVTVGNGYESLLHLLLFLQKKFAKKKKPIVTTRWQEASQSHKRPIRQTCFPARAVLKQNSG